MRALYTLLNWLLWMRIHLMLSFRMCTNTNAKKLGKTHELTFLDDFNKKELNTDHWRTDNQFGLPIYPESIIERNVGPDVIYTNTNHIMSDGKIYMYTKKENIQYYFQDWDGTDWGAWTIPYSSGQILQNKFEQKYGYFEACISIPQTPGISPAFLVCSKNSKLQLDIFHSCSNENTDFSDSILTRYNSMNVWAVDWQEDYMKFYWNNVLGRVVYDRAVLDRFDGPMFLKISNGIDVKAGSRIKEMESPNFLAVEWVRVWTRLS